ncbi:MAG: glycosyltransferase family 4 protein [bacterium]
MRVLVVTSSYPRSATDIAGFFVRDHVEMLREFGHDVDVMTWQDTADPHDDGVIRVQYAPRSLQTLFYGAGAPENLSSAANGLLVPQAMVAMEREVARRAPAYDLLIGHWLVPAGLIVRRVGARLGRPTLVIGHSGGVHALAKLPRRVGRSMARTIAAGPTTVPTQILKDLLDRTCGLTTRAQILPMGFTPISPAPKLGRALFMGRLVPIKRVDIAIRACAAARVGLDVAGDGPMRTDLETLATELGADVHFWGLVFGHQKADLVAAASAFVLPSGRLRGRHEGLPVSLLEAASAGAVPVVGDLPGSDLLTPEPWQRPADAADWSASVRLATTPLPALRSRVSAAAEGLTWRNLSGRWREVVETAAAWRPE